MADHEDRARRVPEVASTPTVTDAPRPPDGSRRRPTHGSRPPPRARSSTVPPAAPRRTGIRRSRRSICPFCGAESPATLQTRGADTVIVEHDLAAALRAIPDSARGWQAREDLGPLSELPGDLGLRRRRGRPPLRFLRVDGARALRGGQGSVSSGVAPAAEDRRVAGARSDSRVVRPAVAGAQQPSMRRRSPTRSRASIFPYWTFDAKADAQLDRRSRRATTTSAKATSRCRRSDGGRPPARCRTRSTTSWCARRWAWTRQSCGRSSRSRPARSCRSIPAISRAGRSSAIRSTWWRRRSDRASR